VKRLEHLPSICPSFPTLILSSLTKSAFSPTLPYLPSCYSCPPHPATPPLILTHLSTASFVSPFSPVAIPLFPPPPLSQSLAPLFPYSPLCLTSSLSYTSYLLPPPYPFFPPSRTSIPISLSTFSPPSLPPPPRPTPLPASPPFPYFSPSPPRIFYFLTFSSFLLVFSF